MFPELVTRPDLRVFLPPIGGTTVYLFGDMEQARRSAHPHHLPRARRVQRLRRVRLRHLHLPALSHSRHRGMRARRAAGRARHHRLQPQGGPRARRGDQVPGLQRPQAAGGRRRRGDLFRAHRMRRRRAGRALPATDARRAALARRAAHRPLRVDERHEARRAGRPGHRHRRARADPDRAGAARRPCRDRGQEGRRLLHAGAAEARATCRTRPAGRSTSTDRVAERRASRRAFRLLSAAAVRERAHKMLALGDERCRISGSISAGSTRRPIWWSTRREAAYPSLDVPFHSRWRHFDIDGVDHWATIDHGDGVAVARERARAAFDLAIVSVLLDAGAGPALDASAIR